MMIPAQHRLPKIFGLFSAKPHPLPLVLLLLIAVVTLYGRFLWNPLVFDDIPFFDVEVNQNSVHSIFDLRWLSDATFGWTVKLFGKNLLGFRLGNLLLHAGNAIALFFFLRRLFDSVLSHGEAAAKVISERRLSHIWLAFFGALLFALHPVSVYATEYMIQRSILMATFFGLLCWLAYLEGLLRGRWQWFITSAACYLLAVYSKEHAVMIPAIPLALTILLFPLSIKLVKKIALPFFLFALIGVLITLKAKGVLGTAYEPYAQGLLAQMSETQVMVTTKHDSNPYMLSVATQCLLFFKYWLLWVLPNPAWMSVDMREPFATSLTEWRYVLGMIAFVSYVVGALWLLLQRGKKGLLGLALLIPWLLFITELTTVRIQEPFVLYRSYLWMGGAISLLPVLLLSNIPARRAVVYLLVASLLMLPLTWNRLNTFSHPLLLWDDAVSLIEERAYLPGFERVYHNRGAAFYEAGMKQRALEDYNHVIALNPRHGFVYNNRGAVYFDWGQYDEALRDFNKSTEIEPGYPRPYLGRGLLFEKLNNPTAARENYAVSCKMRLREGCDMLRRMDVSSVRVLPP